MKISSSTTLQKLVLHNHYRYYSLLKVCLRKSCSLLHLLPKFLQVVNFKTLERHVLNAGKLKSCMSGTHMGVGAYSKERKTPGL